MVIETAKVDIERLRELYSNDGTARSILDHFAARERNWMTSTVDRILENVLNSGGELSRGDVIRAFKALEECGCGSFKVGRKGWPSRFEWTAPMVSVGQAASGETERIEEATEEELEEEEPAGLLKHTYRLRADLTVILELPRDLRPTEAKRLAEFIGTLPFETEAS